MLSHPIHVRSHFVRCGSLRTEIGTYHSKNEEQQQTDLMKAVNSIPAYIERSTHFIALCPEITHAEQSGVRCNLGSWFDRGWCRVEQMSLLLTRRRERPAIVVKGGLTTPTLVSPVDALFRTPGTGKFSCCQHDHRFENEDGSIRQIKCDKSVIGQVIWRLLEARATDHIEVRLPL